MLRVVEERRMRGDRRVAEVEEGRAILAAQRLEARKDVGPVAGESLHLAELGRIRQHDTYALRGAQTQQFLHFGDPGRLDADAHAIGVAVAKAVEFAGPRA